MGCKSFSNIALILRQRDVLRLRGALRMLKNREECKILYRMNSSHLFIPSHRLLEHLFSFLLLPCSATLY